MTKGKIQQEKPLKPDESDLVIIDATLMIALDAPKDRAFIMDIEAMLVSFIQDTRMERTELEPINSYYRLLVHRIARYYGIEHTIEAARPAVLLLSKTLETKMPLIKLAELIEKAEPSHPSLMKQPQHTVPMRIMKREAGKAESSSTSSPAPASMAQAFSSPARNQQDEYAKARAQIFDNFDASSSNDHAMAPPTLPTAHALPHSEPAAPSSHAPDNQFKGWKLDAPEFDPFAPVPETILPVRPLFTKPVIIFEMIHMPSHILLVRLNEAPSGNGHLQPFLERLNQHLGSSWELRTKPTHRDALLICASLVQADHVLNEAKFKVPGVSVMPWKPRFYAEP